MRREFSITMRSRRKSLKVCASEIYAIILSNKYFLSQQKAAKLNKGFERTKQLSRKLWPLKNFIPLKSKLHNHQMQNKFFNCSISLSSYHQKYRLQGHRDLAKTLGLNSKLLQTSHVATRLNGFLVGLGGVQQFQDEVDNLGLDKKQSDYVLKYLKENEGGNLYC